MTAIAIITEMAAAKLQLSIATCVTLRTIRGKTAYFFLTRFSGKDIPQIKNAHLAKPPTAKRISSPKIFRQSHFTCSLALTSLKRSCRLTSPFHSFSSMQ